VNATSAARSPSFSRRSPRSSDPKIHWARYGLTSRPAWKLFPSPTRYESLSRPERFRLALEETGGLFEIFGRFLSGRSDLLSQAYLTELLNLRSSRKPVADVTALPELQGVTDLALLGFSPLGEIYSGAFAERAVVIEIFPAPGTERRDLAWRRFTRQIRRLDNSAEHSVAGNDVLDQFREWLEWQGSVERKRSILNNLSRLPFATATRFPRLIEELQSERCLVYEKYQGEPLSERLRSEKGGSEALDLWAESLLEQSLLLSLIDSESRPENYILLSDGTIGFASVPSFAIVPVEWHSEMVQYTAAAAAGNSQRAIQMLSRICAAESAYDVEQRLLERLSALQPELKIQQSIPPSVITVENYWRSMRFGAVPAPLFLHLYHRNLSVLGQMAGGKKAQRGDQDDPIAGGLWPTLGRLLQYRLGELVSSEKGFEWLYSSGLLLMSATRQMAITLEQVRDNDVALLVEGPDDDTREEIRTRRVASAIRSALALGLLLLAAEIAHQTSGTISVVATTAAAVSAIVLCAVIARIK